MILLVICFYLNWPFRCSILKNTQECWKSYMREYIIRPQWTENQIVSRYRLFTFLILVLCVTVSVIVLEHSHTHTGRPRHGTCGELQESVLSFYFILGSLSYVCISVYPELACQWLTRLAFFLPSSPRHARIASISHSSRFLWGPGLGHWVRVIHLMWQVIFNPQSQDTSPPNIVLSIDQKYSLAHICKYSCVYVCTHSCVCLWLNRQQLAYQHILYHWDMSVR